MRKEIEEKVRKIRERLHTTKVQVIEIVKFGSLTPEQKLEIKGEKGEKGDVGPGGPQGTPLRFEDMTEVQKMQLKGEKGNTGDKGDTGPTGPQGPAVDEHGVLARLKGFALDLIPIEVRKQVIDMEGRLMRGLEERMAKIAQSLQRPPGGGTHIAIGDTAPNNPKENQLWVDTS